MHTTPTPSAQYAALHAQVLQHLARLHEQLLAHQALAADARWHGAHAYHQGLVIDLAQLAEDLAELGQNLPRIP
jgi:hypothetical protein